MTIKPDWNTLDHKTKLDVLRNFSTDQITAVRLEVEENQLVGIFSKIGVVVDALKGA
jgi:hypothetical protein